MNSEKNPWLMTASELKKWEEQQSREFALLRATPEYQKRNKDIQMLCNIMGDMVYPVKARSEYKKVDPIVFGRLKPQYKNSTEYDEDWNKKGQRLSQALRRYGSHFCLETPEVVAGRGCLSPIGKDYQESIEEACKASHWPFKVGASLYIFQQMHDRKLSPEPSLSKAQWLITNAPLTEAESISQTERGDYRKIGEQWKHYFPVAHYWAAFVVLIGTPLKYADTALLDFIRPADAYEFIRLAASFLEFRKRVNVTFGASTSHKVPYIKQGIDSYMENLFFKNAEPTLPNEIPNLLTDFQWAALSHYQSPLRKSVK